MLRLSALTTVHAELNATWQAVSDTEAYAAWIDHTLAIVRTDGIVAVGGRYEERSRLLGPIGIRTRWVVAELDPPRRQVHLGHGLPLMEELRAEFDLEALGPRTTAVTFTLVAVPRARADAFAVLARPLLQRRQRRSVRALGAILDGARA